MLWLGEIPIIHLSLASACAAQLQEDIPFVFLTLSISTLARLTNALTGMR